MTAMLGSCVSILSSLREDDDVLKSIVLHKLNQPGVVEMYWTEIADYLADIEVLHEDESFPERKLAALVAAKVYYHLDEPDFALRLALRSGDLFDVKDSESPFIRAIIGYCVDKYVKNRAQLDTEVKSPRPNIGLEDEDIPIENDFVTQDSEEDLKAIDSLIQSLHKSCIERGELTYALGLAFESASIERVEEILNVAKNRQAEILNYCLEQAPRVLSSNRKFRRSVLRSVLKSFEKLAKIDLSSDVTVVNGDEQRDSALLAVCQGLGTTLMRLQDHEGAAKLLIRLAKSDNIRLQLSSLQIAFEFLLADQTPFLHALCANEVFHNAQVAEGEIVAEEDSSTVRVRKVLDILQGAEWARISVQMLAKSNKTDMGLLDRLREHDLGGITHNGLVVAHAFAQAGTTNDSFLRVNIDWLAKAQCWNKFTATASMGAVHAGQAKGKKVLAKYLPPEGSNGTDASSATRSSYSEAGAFYALGLIHASAPNTPPAIAAREYLLQQLKDYHTSEVRLHGACLGLGLLTVGLADTTVYEALRTVLYTDMAIAGEAAALSIGLLMQGSNDAAVIDALHAYAHESPHEKIVRACALALGLVAFRREESAEGLISQLCLDADATIRYGGVMACGMAYAGTSSIAAQRRLLKISVSDASEDVRRGAVIALGFVLADRPHLVPKALKLIAENFSFHVRYGAAIALGISCAGTHDSEAVDLLLQLRSDPHDVVRQAAGISLGLVLMNASDVAGTRVGEARENLLKAAIDRKETQISRMGAEIGVGLLNSAGRHGTASFIVTAGENNEVTGQVRYHSAAGLFLMSQLWYWFPLSLCGSIAIRPALLVGITGKLQVPKNFEVRCTARKEKFAFPEDIKKEQKVTAEKVATVTLSVTKPKEDTAVTATAAAEDKDTVMKEGTQQHAAGDEKNESPSDAPAASPVLTSQGTIVRKYETLANPARVLPTLEESVVFISSNSISSNVKFVPLFVPQKAASSNVTSVLPPASNAVTETNKQSMVSYWAAKSGPVILIDLKPEEGSTERVDADVVEEVPVVASNATVVAVTPADPVAEDLAIPEDFEWDGN